MPDPAERYREEAEACRRQAAKSVNPKDAENWLRLADEWQALARASQQENPPAAGSHVAR